MYCKNRQLVLSCEHGGNKIPARFRTLFKDERELLESHRSYDLGALSLAQYLSRKTNAPLHSVKTTRLLIECNRSPENAARFSKWARALPEEERRWLHERVWAPHFEALEKDIAKHLGKGPMLHVSVHSFAPIVNGKHREADVALLYDPKSEQECEVADHWLAAMKEEAPGLQLRRNYPYKGTSDRMTRLLRRTFKGRPYAGLELEVSQAFLRETKRKGRLHALLAETLMNS